MIPLVLKKRILRHLSSKNLVRLGGIKHHLKGLVDVLFHPSTLAPPVVTDGRTLFRIGGENFLRLARTYKKVSGGGMTTNP